MKLSKSIGYSFISWWRLLAWVFILMNVIWCNTEVLLSYSTIDRSQNCKHRVLFILEIYARTYSDLPRTEQK